MENSPAAKMLKELNFNEKSEIYQDINQKMIESTYRYYIASIKEGTISLEKLTEILKEDELPIFVKEMINFEMLSEAKYVCV
jgi:hypothetical protein